MRFYLFESQINEHKILDLLNALKQANGPQGVYVNSPGGTFEFFSQLGPAIERRGIVTLSGDVRSAAVILALLGNRRYALPDSTFFFHEVRTIVNESQQVTLYDLDEFLEYEHYMSGKMREGIQEWRRQMLVAQNWFLRYLSERTGVAIGTLLNLMRSEATLTAHDALRYGIIHEILPCIPME
ncbi:MAG: hypothetical protein AAB515_01640 [Patescibacteria group bacterium]